MTEDPRGFGLTAADLRTAADRLYEPGDDRLDQIDWTHDTQVRYGQIRSRLRGLADAIEPIMTGDPEPGHGREDQDQPAESGPEPDPRTSPPTVRAWPTSSPPSPPTARS